MAEERIPHGLNLEDRKKLRLTGVSEVVSFEENQVLLHTGLGTLAIHGRELQLKNLTLEGGNVTVEGHICALIYEEPRSGGWFSRLLG